MTDSELVKRAKAGDQAAFEQLILRYSRVVYGHVFLWTGSRDGAEDVVQEAMMRAYRALAQLQDGERFRPWLLRVAKRICIDQGRRSERVRVVEEVPAVADEGAEVGRIVLAKERAAAVRDAVAELPERYRMPIALRYFDGLDFDEIATRLDLTRGALRGLLHRGMGKLRAQLVPVLAADRQAGSEGLGG